MLRIYPSVKLFHVQDYCTTISICMNAIESREAKLKERNCDINYGLRIVMWFAVPRCWVLKQGARSLQSSLDLGCTNSVK